MFSRIRLGALKSNIKMTLADQKKENRELEKLKELIASEREELSERNGEISFELDSVQQEIEALKEKLSADNLEEAITDIVAKIEELQEQHQYDVDQINGKDALLSQTDEEMLKLKADLMPLQERNSILESENEQLLYKISELEAELNPGY